MQAEARRLPTGPLPMLSVFDSLLIEFCGLKRFVSLAPEEEPPTAVLPLLAKKLLSPPLFSCCWCCSSSSSWVLRAGLSSVARARAEDRRFLELPRLKRCLKLPCWGGGAKGRRSLDELPLVEAPVLAFLPNPGTAISPAGGLEPTLTSLRLWLWLCASAEDEMVGT